MQTQSDMGRIIAVAEDFLDMDVKKVEDSPVSDTVYHPFFNSQYMSALDVSELQLFTIDTDKIHLSDKFEDARFFDILESPEALQLGKEIWKKRLHKCNTPGDVMFCFREAHYFSFFKEILPFLSEKDLAEILRYIWKTCEVTNKTRAFTKKELTTLFSKCVPEYLMLEEELEALHNFPDELTIYRGVNGLSQKNVRTFSWTLSEEKAEWFANRFSTDYRIVYQANIKKKDIFAYFSGIEEEIVVNPTKLKNITSWVPPMQFESEATEKEAQIFIKISGYQPE